MNFKKHIALLALALPFVASAQVASVGFEDTSEYTSVGVYDSWPDSPFMTGDLEGNVAVITNELTEVDDVLGTVVNSSGKMLAFQRSQWGGNQYGARIDLAEPFQLSTTTQYVHVFIYKNKGGRVMLTGLGTRVDRPSQTETEQFNELTTTTVGTGKWYDAVFAISGSDSVMINTLVVVPHLESTHDLSSDFVVYIDEIVVNSSPTARVSYDYYPINYDKEETLDRTDRYTESIGLTSPTDGAQTLSVPQQSDQLLYQDLLSESLCAKAGEEVTPAIGYVSNWMHGYVYLDKDLDGQFNVTINDDYTLPDESDLVSFSYYEGVNSLGETASASTAITPPAFTVPEDLEPGFYRLRYKVDWNSIDAGGSTDESNLITDNGGAIIDTRLNVHEDSVTISRGVASDGVGGLNGDILASDASELGGRKIPFGEPFEILASPANNFKLSYIIVRHGYNLEDDSLIYDTPQYVDEYLPAYVFEDNFLTLPASYIDGDVSIIPYFSSTDGTSTSDEDYPINFDEDLTISRTDRYLTSFKVKAGSNSAKTIKGSGQQGTVYVDRTSTVVPAQAGDELVLSSVSWTGSTMHMYLYIDYDMDGQFSYTINDDGTPTYSSELVSYTCYNKLNSNGDAVTPSAAGMDTIPTITLPELLPKGVYRARFKIDWNSIDPGGNYTGSNDIDDNGGTIVDFLINIYGDDHVMVTTVTNGSANNGTSTTNVTGIPETVTPYSTFRFRLTPIEDTYTCDSVTILHGHTSKDQIIHGNPQWGEYKVKYSKTISVKADSVNGDLYLTADFEPTSDSEYELVFSDEFDDLSDGSVPSTKRWGHPSRANSVWNRYVSTSKKGYKLTTYIEDGKLLLTAIPNPYTSSDNVPMITGAVYTSDINEWMYGKFEARILTDPYTGNFPAFWLMPGYSVTWPYGGEIDIWEQIDAENVAWHTVHTEWANILGNTTNPTRSSSLSNVTSGNYHTFGLEWTDSLLTWYVDGVESFSYAKSDDDEALDGGQWPFDHEFYIILNQSVGNGTWAADADTTHTYTTKVDWVRVYQKENGATMNGVLAGVGDVTTSGTTAYELKIYPSEGNILVVTPTPTQVNIYDLSGRLLLSRKVQGNVNLPVPHGVYIVNGKKVLVP